MKDFKEFKQNLLIVEDLAVVKVAMVGFDFEVPKGKMKFLGLKSSRKNALAVVYNSDLKKLQTFSQDAILFHYRRATGYFKKC